MYNKITIRSLLLLVGAIVAVVVVLAVVRDSPGQDSPGQDSPGISIISPPNGATINAGSTITVIVRPTGQISLNKVFLSTKATALEDQAAPFEFSVTISNNSTGPQEIAAIGFASDGQIFTAETSINVVAPAMVTPESLTMMPGGINFERIGAKQQVGVQGRFSDGETRSVTRAPDTIFSSQNEKVATVTKSGLVEAVAPGKTTITAQHKSQSTAIPVTVLIFELRGDLDGDTDVDQDDINILVAARNTAATGPGDPRDLNNDGVIDALDARILVTLCSRGRCATQ